MRNLKRDMLFFHIPIWLMVRPLTIRLGIVQDVRRTFTVV